MYNLIICHTRAILSRLMIDDRDANLPTCHLPFSFFRILLHDYAKLSARDNHDDEQDDDKRRALLSSSCFIITMIIITGTLPTVCTSKNEHSFTASEACLIDSISSLNTYVNKYTTWKRKPRIS